MKEFNLITAYSLRLLYRQWRRFVLPFFSLLITAVVLMVVLLLSSASGLLLSNQARELTGGDVVLEGSVAIDTQAVWQQTGIEPLQESSQLQFTGTLQNDTVTAPFSIRVVDQNFPLYGSFTLSEGEYKNPDDNEIYLDQSGANRLNVEVGDELTFGTTTFKLAGIVISEPTSLFGGFRFLPNAFLSDAGFSKIGIDMSLLRVEYIYAAKFTSLLEESITKLRQIESDSGREIDVDIAGQDRTGLQSGLRIVSDFLIVAVLITAALAAVNIYASTLYLVTVERKSLAVLLALGMRKKLLITVLGAALLYVVLISGVLGVLLGAGLFKVLSTYVASAYAVVLPWPNVLVYAGLGLFLLVTIALASFAPAVRQSLAQNPKQILLGNDEIKVGKVAVRSLLFLTLSTLAPLVLLASYLLKDIGQGFLVVLAMVGVYVLVAVVFFLILNLLYKKRAKFSFLIRSIISQKKADGLFGIVSFTSLFIALTALCTLALLKIGLERYLTEDLSRTVPTTYVLDIQSSQKDAVLLNFPKLELFSNVPARIESIDDLFIQEELAQGNEAVDRELGREFNLTARSELLSSETITAGVWGSGRKNEISVDEEFAKRANIKLGTKLAFTVQGFAVSGEVTSLRATDSRSGLPFFYFVLSPEDIGMFPSVYFGYSYFNSEEQSELGRFLATNMPNVSMIETQALGPILLKLVGTLLVMVLVVTLPPLLIATLLISTLIVSSYAARRRDGARLRAVGATRRSVLIRYVSETISLTVAAALVAYLFSVILAFGISNYFLGIETATIFDFEIISGLALVIFLSGIIGLYLFKTDTMPLRELLSYESSE